MGGSEEHQSYQFSLRRLLLWTAAIAVYLSVAKIVSFGPAEFAQITTLLLVIGLLRAVAGPVAAAIGSLVVCLGGILAFLVVEVTAITINWIDARLEHGTQTFTPFLPRISSPGSRLALGSLLVGILGSLVPIFILIELWQEPVGSGIRPMNLPMAMIWCGLGTPFVMAFFHAFAARLEANLEGPRRRRPFSLLVIALSVLTALLPLFLTTFAASWVIQARSLWLKP